MAFLGNEKAKSTLLKMRDSERFSHAILLTGQKGLGKKEFARLIAKTVLCENKNAPCNVCENCLKINSGNHADVTEVFEFTRANSFSVDKVREIRSTAYISPNEAKKRVFILANADCMNDSAQNALLKIIEEPPETAVFILTAQNRERLLPTVLSRCVTIPVLPIDDESAKMRVKELYPNVNEKLLNELSSVFGGNVGALYDAVKNEKSLEVINYSKELLKTLCDSDRYRTLVVLSRLQNSAAATEVLENAVFLLSQSVAGKSFENLDSAPLEMRVFWLSELISALSAAQKNANIPLLMTQLCIKLYTGENV